MNIYKLILERDSYTLLKLYYKTLLISEACTDNYFLNANILCLDLLFSPIPCSRNLNQPHEQEDFYEKGFRLQKSRWVLRGLNIQVFAATALHISESVFSKVYFSKIHIISRGYVVPGCRWGTPREKYPIKLCKVQTHEI